jgi:nicotinamide mononucleotide transporter
MIGTLSVSADTYYISPQGSDISGNGSKTKPWQTLFKATLTSIKEGDIILVMDGIYIETKPSVLSVGVSIEGKGINSVIKSTVTTDWTPILSLRSPEGTKGNQHISNLKFDGQNLSTFWAVFISGRSNVSIYNCTIIDFKDKGVIFDGKNDNIPSAPSIYATGNSFHHNIVNNCSAYNTQNGIYGRGCLNIGGQDGMLIYNNTITQNSRPEGYNGFAIKYSNDGFLKGVKIFNNTITKIPFSGNYGGENGWDFSIELWNVLGGMEIYGNTIEGSIDIVNTSKNSYKFGVWLHDNKVSQQKLNSHFESGVIFELSTEAAIVEGNNFNNISGCILFNAQINTVIRDITIRKNVFSNIGKNTGNGNNGSGINLSTGSLYGNDLCYTINNVSIAENFFIAAKKNAPYYGIQINEAASAKNIKIKNNTFENFTAAYIIANPAYVIDSFFIENNILKGNGNNNDPFYIGGTPSNYILKKNTKVLSSLGSNSSFNFREQILRPFYYDLKRTTLLEYIAVIAGILSVWFSRKENIYVYPIGLINTIIYIFLSFNQGLLGEASVNFYYTVMSIYGWMLWSKRDKQHHKIVKITSSSIKEWLIHIAFFAAFFIAIYFSLTYLKKSFAQGAIPWADAFASATAFTGMWLMTKKKVESWYWWIATNIASIPLYFVKHFVLTSVYYGILLIMAIMGLQEWKKRKLNASIL